LAQSCRQQLKFFLNTQMRIITLYVLGILAALSMAGCAEFVYNSMENARVAACDSLRGQEHLDCMAEAEKAYVTYEREREQALNKDN
jgi:hypothetical protein